MKKTSWLILILSIIIVLMAIMGIRQVLAQPLQGLVLHSDNTTISIDEAIAIVSEARDSHIIFKAALEIGFAQATEWTGNITDQDRIIARYSKVLKLLESLKQPTAEEEANNCCCGKAQ